MCARRLCGQKYDFIPLYVRLATLLVGFRHLGEAVAAFCALVCMSLAACRNFAWALAEICMP